MNIIIVSHGQFGHGLLNAYEMLRGKNHRIQSVSFDVNDSVNFERRLASLIDCNLKEHQEILILSDMEEGEPHQKAKNFIELSPDNVQLVSAVNLPMLVEACELTDSVLSVSDLAMFIQEDKY